MKYIIDQGQIYANVNDIINELNNSELIWNINPIILWLQKWKLQVYEIEAKGRK